MVFGPGGNVHDPQKPLFLTLDTKKELCKTIQGKSRTILANIILGRSQSLKNRKMEKMRSENPGYPSYQFLKVLNMGSISSEKHDMEILDFQFN